MKKLLKQRSKSNGTAKSKSSIPTVDADSKLKRTVDQFLASKRKLVDVTAKVKSLEGLILEFFSDRQDTDGFGGRYSKSYKIPGGESVITVTRSNSATVNTDHVSDIKKIVGKTGFRDLFEETFKVQLKSDVVGNKKEERVFTELMKDEKVQQFLDRFFDVTDTLVIKSNFDKDVYKYTTKESLDELRLYVKMKKPSVK